jgi:hypothetical protein
MSGSFVLNDYDASVIPTMISAQEVLQAVRLTPISKPPITDHYSPILGTP